MKYVIILHFVTVLVGGLSESELKIKWMHHSERVSASKFPCLAPQPRAIDVRELIMNANEDEGNEHLKEWPGIIPISPATTILHRCEGSGCCKRRRETCHPRLIEEIDLPIFLLRIGHGRTQRGQIIELKAENHTECVCERILKEIK